VSCLEFQEARLKVMCIFTELQKNAASTTITGDREIFLLFSMLQKLEFGFCSKKKDALSRRSMVTRAQ